MALLDLYVNYIKNEIVEFIDTLLSKIDHMSDASELINRD